MHARVHVTSFGQSETCVAHKLAHTVSRIRFLAQGRVAQYVQYVRTYSTCTVHVKGAPM
jgi:hypothetical protein